jgi:hypothetical protein
MNDINLIANATAMNSGAILSTDPARGVRQTHRFLPFPGHLTGA